MLNNPSYVNVSGPPVTMMINNAPVKDVLMAISRLGGYGFVYVTDSDPDSKFKDLDKRKISISFRNESYSRALNSALLAAGLQGKRDGSMIMAGPNVLTKSFGATMSKVFRLNQASANSAGDYLANLGASVTKTNTITTAVTQGVDQNAAVSGAPSAATTQSRTKTSVESYGASSGPLVGLLATTDTRLSTITLVGSPQLVAVGEQYLKQIDLRQRQVALSVKILDVTLENDAAINNSFAFRYGNNFIVNDNGQLLGAFGRYQPATNGSFDNTEIVRSSGSSSTFESSSSSSSVRLDDNTASQLSSEQLSTLNSRLSQESGSELVRQTNPETGDISVQLVPIFSDKPTLSSESLSRAQAILNRELGRRVGLLADRSSETNQGQDSQTNFVGARRPNPGMMYPKDSFFDFIRAQIQSRSTKVLASPTLILSENPATLREGEDTAAFSQQLPGSGSSSSSSNGDDEASIGRSKANEAYVTVGEQIIVNYAATPGQNGAPTTCQPEFGISGLTFGAKVTKIDDNGFVTFAMTPAITAATRTQLVPNCGLIDILAIRRLDTGSARVRDGQTLIMTGVISDADNQTVSKWPILGDLPLVGQFFRATAGARDKRELVIMVTPRIIMEDQGGNFGYGYQPGTSQARDLMRLNNK
jgi:type IV pilus assembly protein PilQ